MLKFLRTISRNIVLTSIGEDNRSQGPIQHLYRIAQHVLDNVFGLWLGDIFVTFATSEALSCGTVNRLIDRHQDGDWGYVEAEQVQYNKQCVGFPRIGGTIHSTYNVVESEPVHILTYSCDCEAKKARRTIVCLTSDLDAPPCPCVWRQVPPGLLPSTKAFPRYVRLELNEILALVWAEQLDSYISCPPQERQHHILDSVWTVTQWLQGRVYPPKSLDQYLAHLLRPPRK